jgi:diguanylate cyclase (GGDEF)-like protein
MTDDEPITKLDQAVPLVSQLSVARRSWAVALAAVGVAVVLGILAVAIAGSRAHTRSEILASFRLHGTSAATFASTFVEGQARHERETARLALSGARVSPQRFQLVVDAFGSDAAVLLDSAGRLLDVTPSDPALIGRQFADRYAHLSAAERGSVAVSNVVPSAARKTPVSAIAVPFATPAGRRVFSVAYGVAGSVLEAFVAHTISWPRHNVYLLDSSGRVLAASPATSAATISAADPTLARAIPGAVGGSVTGVAGPDTFAVAPIADTPWRIVIAEPSSHLFASISGAAAWLPWAVFALVSLFGVLLVVLFARSVGDRAHLLALSRMMSKRARTDWLTGSYNRRALSEHLARATAYARRHGEPLSVMMIDIDNFKQTNDRFGHHAGDEVLKAVCGCMGSALRADDVYGRWGGDEFLVILPAIDEVAVHIAARRLRDAAEALALDDVDLGDGVQLSVGTATGVHTSPDALALAADLDLYQAKAAKRASGAAAARS